MKLLVLSNNSFSKSNNNGRTLGGLLQGWPKDKIAQFCISSDGADYDVCENYYCVTDGDVLHSTLKFKSAERRTLNQAIKVDSNSDNNGHIRFSKTTFRMFLRNIAWDLGFWKGESFNKWVDDFSPDIILLQSGESYFMHKLAIKLSKRTGAKLAIFNAEGYYLFKSDYFTSDGRIGRLLFKLYQRIYKKHFREFMNLCSKQIYLNEKLREDYDNEFKNTNSCVIYTPSSLTFDARPISENPIFSYFGNMGYDRPKALIEFAETINAIDPHYILDVYGFAKNVEMENRLNSCSAIRFHGAIPYNEVLQKMGESDFLIHVESQDEMWAESLKYGFSTKIADSISSGKIFILYCSPDIACAKYIQATGAGIFASNTSDLRQKIVEVINSAERSRSIEEAEHRTAKLNHDFATNSAAMAEYLSE